MIQTGSKRRYSTRSSTSTYHVVERKTAARAEKAPTVAIENEELECAICTDEYNDPKLLHCMHTFCGGCIEQLQKHGNEENVTCPKCRFVTKVGGEENFQLLPNHIIRQKVQHHQATLKRNEKMLPCSDCESEKATGVCTTCCLKYCDCCASHHKRCVRFKDHEIQSIEDASNVELFDKQPILCSIHKQEMKYLCDTCKETICLQCMLGKLHQGHVFHSVAEVKERELESLKESANDADVVLEDYDGYLEKVDAFQRKSVEEGDASKKLVEDTFAELNGILQGEKQKLLDWLNEKNESSASAAKNAKETANHVKSLVGHTKEVLECPAAEVFDLVNGTAHLNKRISCIKTVNEDRAGVSSDIVFAPLVNNVPSVEKKNDFDVQLVARQIERSFSVEAFKKNLQTVKNSFILKECHFPDSTGVCIFNIKDVSQLKRACLRKQITHRGYVWTLKAMRKCITNASGERVKSLGVSIKCKPKQKKRAWQCLAQCKISLKNHRWADISRRVSYKFWESAHNLGYPRFISWKDLTNEGNGYIKDGSITIIALVQILS